MNLTIHATALDLLATFLRRQLLAPSDLPAETSTRTGAALARAIHAWQADHRRTESSVQAHLLDIRRFAHHAVAGDLRLARALGGS